MGWSMDWLTLLGITLGQQTNMDVEQCIRALRCCTDLNREDSEDIIERLEELTGHPDIMTYLHDNPWRSHHPSLLHQDLLAEVQLLHQLIDTVADGDVIRRFESKHNPT